ncbi:hypothetical protein DSM106972_011570 [Dulcicalothrix desertica PCC 7102]|uniref:Uncharacterized protein n=2 Tax=Dulcicalothrix desertica TaxID=32056 RepID=A0A433VSP4_9CYAN|nr:hypothetical protein DSM106972_011570 [Dulcicalothrix desertica PCC 7102]TWH55143.1 hypothetical protein CAL7102_03247 [Dulcicalothrix desertica PCC 7102]
MQALFWTVEEVAQRAKDFYENGIRQEVEHDDNIGKMIVIDAETGEYGIDESGVESILMLKQKNPNARLYMMRIGYDAAVSFGGSSMELTAESYNYLKSKEAGVIMQAIFWTEEEVAQRAKDFYENGIRQKVEHGDNIGKMIVIDAETSEYGIDEIGIEPGKRLKQKNPNARLFMMRIGYNAAFGFGGAMERIAE